MSLKTEMVTGYQTKECIAHRDTKNYLGVLLDDNNRQPVCRFWFNSGNKYLGLFDAEKTKLNFR